MSNYFTKSIILIVFTLQACHYNETKILEDVTTCFSTKYPETLSDKTILNFENELIKKKILSESSTASYVKLLQQMKEADDVSLTLKKSDFIEFENVNIKMLRSPKCLALCTNKKEKAKLMALATELEQLDIFNHYISKFANAFLKNLDESDYKQKYYKCLIFTFLYHFSEDNSNFIIPTN